MFGNFFVRSYRQRKTLEQSENCSYFHDDKLLVNTNDNVEISNNQTIGTTFRKSNMKEL